MKVNANDLRECHACRKKKLIVHRIARMNYCESCKHKAPTRSEYERYLTEGPYLQVLREITEGEEFKFED